MANTAGQSNPSRLPNPVVKLARKVKIAVYTGMINPPTRVAPAAARGS